MSDKLEELLQKAIASQEAGAQWRATMESRMAGYEGMYGQIVTSWEKGDGIPTRVAMNERALQTISKQMETLLAAVTDLKLDIARDATGLVKTQIEADAVKTGAKLSGAAKVAAAALALIGAAIGAAVTYLASH